MRSAKREKLWRGGGDGPRGAGARRGGFTLIEMVTAVALLVITILAVGMIFRIASAAVSLSEVSMEVVSNVRAVEVQVQTDLTGLDPSCFLVIRSRQINWGDAWVAGTYYASGARVLSGSTVYRATVGHTATSANMPSSAAGSLGQKYWIATTDRADMLAFVSSGAFPNRTGDKNGKFSDATVANAALIVYGQGIWELPQGSTMLNAVIPPSESQPVAVNAMPSGSQDQDFVLLRRTLLLMAGSGGGAIPYYDYPWQTNPAGGGASRLYGASVDADAVIASSRWCATGLTPNQLMQMVQAGKSGNSLYEANGFCFRSKVVPNVWADTNKTPVNGALRMHPIAMRGVASFRVDWTDGTTLPVTNGPLAWYGLNDGKGVAPRGIAAESSTASGDGYTAVFSFDNRVSANGQRGWPKALRIWYRVTDPNDRLRGGRDFVQVVALPQ